MEINNKILAEYHEQKNLYDDFRLKVELFLKELMIQNSVHFHQISSRLKSSQKLDEKITRKNEKYNNLNEITDIAGVRIITYFEDEVDIIEKLLLSEFIVDKNNTIDKRKLDIDRFGYKSLHYVVSLNSNREKLVEYKRFNGLKVEIQIRSILQHAWAEIEHDIGYKGEILIPTSLKRNFHRVAALLETSDIEFVNIKRQLSVYKQIVENKINSESDFEIDKISYSSFLRNESIVKEIDTKIAKQSNLKYNDILKEIESIELERLQFLKIFSIQELKKLLVENEDRLLKIAYQWLGIKDNRSSVTLGISIFYLCYVLVGQKDKHTVEEYFDTYIYEGGVDHRETEKSANTLISAVKQLK